MITEARLAPDCDRFADEQQEGPRLVLDVSTITSSLRELGAATLGESGARPMRDRIRAAWAGAAVVGPAIPVLCTPGDNLAIHVAVANAPTGSVLTVNVGDIPELGYWGEVLTTGAQSRGILGLVIDGGVRDVDALERLKFPTFSSTVSHGNTPFS